MTLTHLLVGPRPHGVVRFGWDLHEMMRAAGFAVRREWAAHFGCLTTAGAAGAIHLQFTDRLFGACPEDAAALVTSLAAAHPGRVTATLHDLPQPSDGTNFSRRTAAYAAVADACDGIAVSSDHERELMRDSGIHAAQVAVIPLPIAPRVTSRPAGRPRRSVGVFGYLYPGKGHAEVLAAAAEFAGLDVVAIGESSPGHADLVTELKEAAERRGGVFEVTGFVPDSRLVPMLQEVAVPVVAHRHVSASGSINSWLSAGRRPLAATNRYTVEFESRNPGSLTLYPDTPVGLRDAIGVALAAPATTWLSADTVLSPAPERVARLYHDFFAMRRP